MVKTETIEIARAGARRFEAFVAAPETGAKPAILILSEMFGLNPPMRDLARRYAEQGHCTMVPDVFWRSHVAGGVGYDEEGFAIAWERVRDFDYDGIGADLRLAADALRRQAACNGSKTGSWPVVALGFCMGGRLAFIAAARAGVDAAISLYALSIPKHLDEFDRVEVPMHFHYGDRDQHVPLAEVEAVAARAAGNPHIKVWRYPEAGHSFFNPVRPTYDAKAAALCAERIEAVLKRV